MNIPNRFENILNSELFNDFKPLILPVEEDLKRVQILRNKTKIQNGGLLSFILGTTGIGKTTLAYSIPVFLSDEFSEVIRIPENIDFREVIKWLSSNLPSSSDRSIILLFDGREITDDNIGLSQFLTALNQLLRSRKDIIFLWPTNNKEWHSEVKKKAKEIGGSNFSPDNADILITGLKKSNWKQVLEKILIQLDIVIEEFAVTDNKLDEFVNSEPTLGEFLSKVGSELSENVFELKEIKNLPKVIFSVSSGEEVVGEANRIRKVKTFTLRAHELLNYSPRSESGKFWSERNKDPKQSLAYVISLFDSRLTTIGSSVVTFSCLHFGNDSLKAIPIKHSIRPHISNAKTTLKASDLYKFLTGTTTNELTSTRKGRTSDLTLIAFNEIQKLSATNHKEINKAIAGLLSETLESYDNKTERFEVDAGQQNLYTDLIANINSTELYFEFHHLSVANCKAASMASYIMDKLRAYAFHYNILQR